MVVAEAEAGEAEAVQRGAGPSTAIGTLLPHWMNKRFGAASGVRWFGEELLQRFCLRAFLVARLAAWAGVAARQLDHRRKELL